MKKARSKFRWLRITLRILVLIIGLFIIANFVFDHFVQYRMNDKELRAFFDSNKVSLEIKYYKMAGRKIRYISVGNDTLPTLLFIHGAPSSLSVYRNFYVDSAMLKRFRMLAVDRPGYGYSGFGKPEPSIKKQAEFIRPLLDSLNKITHPVILVGGSYGSSIASRLAMDYPKLVDGLVLMGPSLAPGEEKVFWFTSAVENPLINWFIPRMFQSANTEKINHKKELTKMLPLWPKIKVPVIYMQGQDDELIYTTNAEFAKKQLVNAPSLRIEFFKDRPHFFPLSEKEKIKAGIIDMLDNLRNSVPNSK